jgi:hypothetical protein
MKYLLELNECAELLGSYDSIEEAKREAELLAVEHGEPMRGRIFNTREATEGDRDLFENHDEIAVSEPQWWEGCLVPQDIVENFTTSLQPV